jgi:hypothetical protein
VSPHAADGGRSAIVTDRRVTARTAATLALFELVGSDRARRPEEVGPIAGAPLAEAGALPAIWEAYGAHFRHFTGARLDPQFERLEHPARLTGSIAVTDGAPVVIVGTGPSLRQMLPELRRVRASVHLFTSPRGADALSECGLIPDLVLVEHQTPLDAQFSVQERWHRGRHAIARVPWVAADARTPAPLLDSVPSDRLFVPAPLPSWGLWPATAAALALGSGSRAVALLGVDLGTAGEPDPAHAPLRALLGLLAAHTDVSCVDAGPAGAAKPRWVADSLDALAAGGAASPLAVSTTPWQDAAERLTDAVRLADGIEPLVAHASATLAAACAVRDGDRSAEALAVLTDRLTQLLAAGGRIENRIEVQEGLGASFLPRFWRVPPDPALGARLWRPAALAAHELVGQYRALRQRTLRLGAGR